MSLKIGGNPYKSSLTETQSDAAQGVQEATQVEESQEQPQEQPQVASAEAPAESAAEAPNDSPSVDIDDERVLSYLSEKLGSSFSSLEDLKPKESTLSYASPELEAIDKFIRDTGRGVNDYLYAQSINPTEMTELDAIRAWERINDKETTDEEFNAYLEQKYKLDTEEGGYSDKEILAAKAQLKRDAKIAKDNLAKLKEDYAKPIAEQSDPKNEFSEEDFKRWDKNVKGALKEFGEVEFQDLGFKWGIPEDLKADIIEEVVNASPDFLREYVDNDGVNVADAAAGIAIAKYADRLVKAAIEHGKHLGAENVVKETKNVNFPEQQVSPQVNKPSLNEQIFNQLATKRKGMVIKG